MKVFYTIVVLTIFQVALCLATLAHGGEKPADVYKELFDGHIVNVSDDDLDYEDHNIVVYVFLLHLSQITGKKIYITDVCRPSTGQHEHCNAVDFYLDYGPEELTVCKLYERYLEDAETILEEANYFLVPVRIGIYSVSFHHHVDITGGPGLWGFDFVGDEVGYLEVVEEIRSLLEDEC